jgi:hypothetical protein
MLFTTVVRLPKEDSGLSLSIVRFYNGHIDSNKIDKRKFFRRDMVVLENTLNGKKILRYAMGSSSISKLSISIDYDGSDRLGLKSKDCSIRAYRASTMEIIKWYLYHDDMSVQLSIRLALLGAALGVLGFMTSLISFI